jgi:hypothetical protein
MYTYIIRILNNVWYIFNAFIELFPLRLLEGAESRDKQKKEGYPKAVNQTVLLS